MSDAVDDAIDDHPWLERLTRIGWIAKGVVYTLMGLTAVGVARQNPRSKDASPEGSLGRIADAPFGRVLLAVLTVGLLLYFVWRMLSVAVIDGHGLSEWGDRVGYTFSGLFYAVLAFAAGKGALSGADPEGSNTVEDLSTAVLELTAGRWLLGAAGLVTIGIGGYFAIHKGVQRSFEDELTEVTPQVVTAGVVGWIGRGVVTMFVGFFVVRAAIRFDPDDARGFDRALRQVAGSGVGSAIVLLCAIGLVAYGIFCLLSYRFRTLSES